MIRTTITTFLLTYLLVTKIQASELKIASWNVAWLGSHEYNKRTSQDYDLLQNYAELLDADVIALQEVDGEKWAKKVLGDDYNYYFSTKNWVQRVGVAIRKTSGYKVQASEYKALDVGRVRYGMDLTLSNGERKLRLLAVHLKSGCFELPLDFESVAAMPNSDKRMKRLKTACTKLSKQVAPLESWIDERARENVPFVVLGDFNRRFAIDIEKSYSENKGLWQAIDDEGSEAMWTPTLSQNSKCWGGYYKDYIDHIVLDPLAKAKYIPDSFEQLVFEGKYSRELSRALSDHCPISLSLKL